MSRTFKFSKGSLEVGETRVSGSIKASTSMQQAPDNLAIDTAIENFGPISINEVKQFRYTLSFVGFIMSIVIGGSIGVAMESLECIATLLPISLVIGVVVFVVIFKKLRIYMAQFSNNGQTVYVPFLKKTDHAILTDMDSYVHSLKRK